MPKSCVRVRSLPIGLCWIAGIAGIAGLAGIACGGAPGSPTDRATPLDGPGRRDGPRSQAEAALADRGAADQPQRRRPVVLVHGINGSGKDYAVMIQRLTADGWPAARLHAINFKDPAWGCNVDNAAAVAATVKTALAQSGEQRVDLVAHSMGNLSTRAFLKNQGGTAVVRSYLSLGAMHHGLLPPCLSPLDVCVWKELCESGPFIKQLNDPPATPGPTRWTSIFGTADTTVPNASSQLAGAENIAVDKVTHDGAQGLLEHPAAYEHVRRILLLPD